MRQQFLGRKVEQYSGANGEFKEFCDFGYSFLPNLYQHYVSASTIVKQKIISSVLSENLIFENNQYRTKNINPMIALLCSNSEGCGEIKTGIIHNFLNNSCGVATKVHNSNDILVNLIEVSSFC